ncbi:glycoside hydrolase family 16 protein [Clavulina sp. PMI_390]|nr:glycoside hydrolase family 16 protein [Clavulina sp. PMI_390]
MRIYDFLFNRYISEEWAMATNMTYVNSAGQAIMRVDNWSYLAPGQSRNSVRIESNDVFNEGLFILDIEAAPWGCGVWPAWWSVGPNWPAGGEIDILEGVHDNVHNQVTFHTEDTSTAVAQNFTGGISTTDCYAYADSNSGCAVIDPSVASYGTEFNTLGGGVFAMMWLSDGIRVWFFHRSSIPQDIVDSSPKPSTWGTPTTYLGNGCDIPSHFSDHQLVFDITFCGGAGTSYIDSGCPGTCSERVQEPGNFAVSFFSSPVSLFLPPDILPSHRVWIVALSMAYRMHHGRSTMCTSSVVRVF